MKRIVILLLFLTIIFSSCIRLPKVEDTNFSDLTNAQKELLIRLIATGYNRGGNYTFEKLIELANENGYGYDDNVLEFYKYFIGEINYTTKTKNLEDVPNYDPVIKNYIKNITEEHFKNDSSNLFLIDYYDEKLPSNSNKLYPALNPIRKTKYEKRENLINKLYSKITEYYNSSSTFKAWFDYYYPDKSLSENDLKNFSEYLVDIAYTYLNSNIELNRLKYTSSDLYPKKIKLNDIPVELILAIIMQESRFFPGSFRAEISNGNIYALSFGLTHVLIDADFLDISNNNIDIGDGNKGESNFDLISYFYLGNNRNEETYFSDWDLITIRGSILYSAIYLDMLYQKLIKYIK
ncbi:hypothetical protein SAMN02745164_01730 [Marinitoga hydrogenitolerans DSM 16785]|uniref:Uncharacterized protein n=1 Tax=Marinitoga hydrogenitolerans (strain DSM 16785 / JCM 12826 / AT1271) TaxID=1122195 RepID=A0A1M4YPM1_MARH1|nr:hypothetical protein [Marinitoga hydrogenitolerans]SHF07462.1 hypothetical protein SAMN02745164_01730 [Marinitoga hydrogenitolerans DSM 16785]